MVTALLSLLGPLIGPMLAGLAALVAVIVVYFGIKNRGVKQERERQEVVKAKEVAKVQEKVQEAVSQDAAIDKKVTNEIEQIKKDIVEQSAPSKPNIFRF